MSGKELVLKSMGYVGVALNLHRVFLPQPLAILMYHGIVDEDLTVKDWCFVAARDFRRQMQYLKEQFDVLPLSEAIARHSRNGIHNPTAVITFDDGYQNNFDVAFPILKELGLPATIFLCTDLVETADTVWFCRVNDALSQTKRKSIEWLGRTFSIGAAGQKCQASADIQAKLKKMSPEMLEIELQRLCRMLGYELHHPLADDSPFRMLDRASIKCMAESGLVEFGAHTASHVILSRLDDARQRTEIEDSIQKVERLTGRECKFFAYPNGTTDDYTDVSMTHLRQKGIQAAVTTIAKRNLPGTNRLELGRYGIGEDMSDAQFRCTVHHFSGLVAGWAR